MKRSGIKFIIASQASTTEPRLCPSRVNRGHVASSTRYRFLRKTKCRVAGASVMPNLDCKDRHSEYSALTYKHSYLNFGYNLGFCSIGVTAVDHADNVGLGVLQERYRSPQNTFAAAACITSILQVRSDSQCMRPRANRCLTSKDGRSQRPFCSRTPASLGI